MHLTKLRRLEDAVKDTKSKLLLKRSSEPSLDGLQFVQHQTAAHQAMMIEEFEPDVFTQLIEYIHTGCVTLQARTLLGLMNAADYYGLEELRRGCTSFVSCCINVDTPQAEAPNDVSELYLPGPNEFIPTNLNVDKREVDKVSSPALQL